MKGRLAIGVAALLALWALLFLRVSRDRMTGPSTSGSAESVSRSVPVESPAAARAQPPQAPAAVPPTVPAAPQAPQARELPPPIALGKVEAFKRAHARQPRDAQAAAAEAQIETLFGTELVPRELLVAATCRKTVCRIRVRWSKQRALAYGHFLMAAGVKVRETAVEPLGVPDRTGNLEIDVYVLREGIHSVAQAGGD